MIIPREKEFVKFARAGAVYPVYIQLADTERLGTPADIYEKLTDGQNSDGYSYLLESGRLHSKTGRYSFIGTNPFLIFQSKAHKILLTRINGSRSRQTTRRYQGAPLAILKKILTQYKTVKTAGLPNFTGGAVGYLGYDVCHFFEKLPKLAVDDLGIPDIFFIFTQVIIAFDHLGHNIKVIATPLVDIQDTKNKYEAAYNQAVDLIQSAAGKIINSSGVKNGIPLPDMRNAGRESGQKELFRTFSLESNFTRAGFEAIVRKAKKYIKAGDIFQANLSQRFSAPMVAQPWLLYKTLARINPSPFACYLDFGQVKIASSSPERLIMSEGLQVETRPIAGTRPRGRDKPEDMKLCRELILNEKERAEHIMLVDLERNDLGRVCKYGSVRVDEFMALEEYSHVIHIVSNIRGTLRPDKDRFDLIAASFPGGTITGTPKVRCMEIIDELEPVARGIYTGSIGYLSFNGDMDLNIVIRTFLITGGRAYVQVGAGIVADSDPGREYYETLYKAEALLKALQLTAPGHNAC